MSRWFRMYADAMRDPKIAKLSDRQFRMWVNLLSVAAENDGVIPPLTDLKHVLRARLDHLSTGVKELISAGLIDLLEVGFAPHNWNKRQFKSDTSTGRVQKHRSERNVSETPPETETDTESEDDGGSAREIEPEDAVTVAAAMARIGGVPHVSPAAINRNIETVAQWLGDGFDVDTEIIPVIRAEIADSTESVHSLRYFDAPLRRARARKEAKANGKSEHRNGRASSGDRTIDASFEVFGHPDDDPHPAARGIA